MQKKCGNELALLALRAQDNEKFCSASCEALKRAVEVMCKCGHVMCKCGHSGCWGIRHEFEVDNLRTASVPPPPSSDFLRKRFGHGSGNLLHKGDRLSHGWWESAIAFEGGVFMLTVSQIVNEL